ncbi:MAG: aminoglycoside phosphotransferase family protein [Gaiellaceae bacterium]
MQLTHAQWLASAETLAQECRDEWDLELDDPYEAGAAGYVVGARLPEGTRAVLKLIFPHHESEHEAAALELWDGDGAVRLLAHDRERWAMLLERCEPGTKLCEAVDAETALEVVIDLLPRLWKAAGPPFRSLADEAAWWLSYLPRQWEESGRRVERRLLEEAVSAIEELAPTQGEQVLVNQDLHAENVLAAEREPWLAIDPKPLVGEREFALASLVRASELGHGRREVLRRLDRLTSELGLDRERARRWTIAQTLAWAYDSEWDEPHLEVVRWLVDA